MARRSASKPIEEKPREIDGIPTAHGLTIMGKQYARYTASGHIHITDDGNRLLGRELRDAGREFKEQGAWHGATGRHPARPADPTYTPRPPRPAGEDGRRPSPPGAAARRGDG